MSPNDINRHSKDLRASQDVEPCNKALAVTVSEAASLSGLCRDKIYFAIKTGKLRAKKFGRRTLILTSDLSDFLEELPAFVTED